MEKYHEQKEFVGYTVVTGAGTAVLLELVALACATIFAGGTLFSYKFNGPYKIDSLVESAQIVEQEVPKDTPIYGIGLQEIYAQLGWDPVYHFRDPSDAFGEGWDEVLAWVQQQENILTTDLSVLDYTNVYWELQQISTGAYYCSQILPQMELGQSVYFDASGEDAHRYFINGISGTEVDFAWTDGDAAAFRAYLSEEAVEDLELTINLSKIFSPPQRVHVTCDELVLLDTTIETPNSLIISIPKECITEGYIRLQFQFPDAISPAEVSDSADVRKLAIGMTSLSIQ